VEIVEAMKDDANGAQLV